MESACGAVEATPNYWGKYSCEVTIPLEMAMIATAHDADESDTEDVDVYGLEVTMTIGEAERKFQWRLLTTSEASFENPIGNARDFKWGTNSRPLSV